MKLQSIVGIACGVALASGLVGALSGFRMAASYEASGEQTATIVSSLRQHMTADMMHDSLRGVVFRSLYAVSIHDKAMARDAQEDLQKSAKAFRDAIEAQQKLVLPKSIREPLTKVNAPLSDYVQSAEKLVALGADGKEAEAKAALPAFQTSFSTLEKEMAEISDSIEKASAAEMEAAAQLGRLSMQFNWIMLGLAAVLFSGYFLLCRLFVTGPLAGTTHSMLALAEGKLEEGTTIRSRISEIADLTAALAVFRTNAREKLELAHQRERDNENAEASKRSAMLAMADEFENSVGGSSMFSPTMPATFILRR